MATKSPAQQGGSQSQGTQQQQGSPSSPQQQQQGQKPIIRDWASI